MNDAVVHEVTVAGLRRKLPVVTLANGSRIALFQLLGDVELCTSVALALWKRIENPFDVLVAPAVKAIPLAHELARIAGTSYVILQKVQRGYMDSPINETVRAYTAKMSETLWLDGRDAATLNCRQVCVVDDVFTTGDTLRAASQLVARSGGVVTQRAVVFLEGEIGVLPQSLVWLERLPLFA